MNGKFVRNLVHHKLNEFLKYLLQLSSYISHKVDSKKLSVTFHKIEPQKGESVEKN